MLILAKNKDGKGFNRTGKYNHEEGTITSTDKNGVETVFNIVSKLSDFDGEDISLTVATDTDPSHVIGEDSEEEE